MRRVFALFSLLCTLMAMSAHAQEKPPLLVFAAASLQSAFTSIGAQWQRDGGAPVRFSFAASSALARQIEQGAPADLFASADLDWMDWVSQRNLLRPGVRRSLLGNTLVLITGKDSQASLTIAPGFALASALGDSRLAMGEPNAVPAGRYGKAALTSLGIWEAVAPKIAGAENVRAALNLVARGEAAFGIVYGSDSKSEPKVRIVDTFPAHSHPPIVYPFAITAASKHPEAAAFLDYLASPAAVKVFEAEGFVILNR